MSKLQKDNHDQQMSIKTNREGHSDALHWGLIVGVREPETSQFSPFSRVFLPCTVGPATTNHLSTDYPLAQAPPSSPEQNQTLRDKTLTCPQFVEHWLGHVVHQTVFDRS